MKKILITGANSYIGTSFQKWVSQYPGKYSVETISVRDERWKRESFKNFDVVFHTAAIVHVKENNISEYSKINRDLTVELAKKAKLEGVKQFIFLSTMGVYGTETGIITNDTVPSPKTPYAQSKYDAEQCLIELDSKEFKITILRPPLVYGPSCPGNFNRLKNMAIKLPYFPAISNKRSMIYIDNLSEFIRLLIDYNVKGMFFPQNKEYVHTSVLVVTIGENYGKKIKIINSFNWLLRIIMVFSKSFRKVCGTFVYSKEMPGCSGFSVNGEVHDYEVVAFKESIKKTVRAELGKK